MHGLNSLKRINEQAVEAHRRAAEAKHEAAATAEQKVFPTIKLDPNPHATMKRILDGAKG